MTEKKATHKLEITIIANGEKEIEALNKPHYIVFLADMLSKYYEGARVELRHID